MASPSTPLPERIGRARKEGRFQQALELTRQLYKQDPAEESLALLRQVSFERGEQLRSQGRLQEAAQTFGNIVDMGGPPDFQRVLLEKLAACGRIPTALALAQRLADPQLHMKILGPAADFALQKGDRTLLPAEFQPHFDAVVQAFVHAEAGKDDEARASLQSIGLSSPFLEWRILLRGLLAFYAGDDVRALENWQRLNPERLPARLAAPLRFGIDPAFRAAQPAATQTVLRKQLDVLQGPGGLPVLRTIQAQLAQRGKMAQAFRQMEGLLPALRQQSSPLLPRLAACFRWAVIQDGEPEDIGRFMRVFGAPADDPQLHRMTALALERNGGFAEAHAVWQLFDKELGSLSGTWPGEQARHVRALIWAHLGKLAADGQADEEERMLLPFVPRQQDRPGFKPAAEECYRKSLEIAPESLATHWALFEYLLEQPGKQRQAFKAGKELLERFPDHVETLEALGSLCQGELRLEEACEFLQRALQVNPMASTLRRNLSKVQEMLARQHSVGKCFDDARAACQAAMQLYDQPGKYFLLCLASIIELKAKNSQGHEELLAQAVKEAPYRLPVVFALMCESIRQKLTPAQRKPFAQEFQTALADTVDPGVIPALIGMLNIQRMAGFPYTGQKTHEKKILALFEKAPNAHYAEETLEDLYNVLLDLDATKVVKRSLAQARRRFPDNPWFMLMQAELLLAGGRPHDRYRTEAMLRNVRKLTEELPRGDRQQALLERLQEAEEAVRAFSGLHSIMNRMMEEMFDLP